MDDQVRAVLAEFEAREASEQQRQQRLTFAQLGAQRDAFLLSVGRRTGWLLNAMVREASSKRVLELGTSYGYSTVWLASAVAETGGQVISIDLARDKQDHARAALSRAGLEDHVELRCGDAVELLRQDDSQYDFVLLDTWKDTYIPCFDLFYPKLAPGAVIVADNMHEPAALRLQAARYRQHVRKQSELDTVLLAFGSGLAISRYRSR
jgi:predicted O-methyltransferase YrrM